MEDGRINREQSGSRGEGEWLFAKIKVEWRERERDKFREKLMSRIFEARRRIRVDGD